MYVLSYEHTPPRRNRLIPNPSNLGSGTLCHTDRDAHDVAGEHRAFDDQVHKVRSGRTAATLPTSVRVRGRTHGFWLFL